MKKLTKVVLVIIWTLSLAFLVIALTDIYPDNIFKDYKLLVGIGFIMITGLISVAFKKKIVTTQVLFYQIPVKFFGCGSPFGVVCLCFVRDP